MIQRKLAETVIEERAETWQTQGMETHSASHQREDQENEAGDNNATTPTEMYLPDLDNTPLSQALRKGLDWGVEDEVMVRVPKAEAILRSGHPPNPENIRMGPPTN